MDKQNREPQQDRLEEQQAPLKNTDHAFVQVGRDGEPVMPQRRENAEGERTQDDLRDPDGGTTIKHR